MKLTSRSLLASVLVMAAAAASGTAAAQGTQSTAPASGAHAQTRQNLIAQHLADLRAKLNITPQQEHQWDIYAQTIRDNAQSGGDAIRETAKKVATLSADDAMQSYDALAQLQAQNMHKLSAAFSQLYASLSANQKQVADTLFRNQAQQAQQAHH